MSKRKSVVVPVEAPGTPAPIPGFRVGRQAGLAGIPLSREQIRRELWEDLEPSSPYDCAGTPEGDRVGQTVPGRLAKLGPIMGCATPSREHPTRGQWWFGFLQRGMGKAVAKSTVARAFRDRDAPWCDRTTPKKEAAVRVQELYASQDEARAAGAYIPNAPDQDFPHRWGRGACCHHAKKWEAWRAKVDAEIDALGPFADEAPKSLAREPEWPYLEGLEARCLAGWAARVERAKPKLGLGTHAAQLRAARAHSIMKGETDPVVLAEEAALMGEGWTPANLKKIAKAGRGKAFSTKDRQANALRVFRAVREAEAAKTSRVP